MKCMKKNSQAIEVAGYGETLGIRLLQELAARGLFIFSTDEAKVTGGDLGIDQVLSTAALPPGSGRMAPTLTSGIVC